MCRWREPRRVDERQLLCRFCGLRGYVTYVHWIEEEDDDPHDAHSSKAPVQVPGSLNEVRYGHPQPAQQPTHERGSTRKPRRRNRAKRRLAELQAVVLLGDVYLKCIETIEEWRRGSRASVLSARVPDAIGPGLVLRVRR